ncbi:Hypothetical protein SRAE_X000067700 [Strongyloides ratti]|uniref:Uncharacterized protein n=1 Tax=Strongyloides ratti TaxID=34506 RepID=A0A090LNB2_STRRB|nr:Hypothetical protein SRAE_X000067700 [Strongyloides ratti]CEF71350.1 Hypothetical protein SRAE_X000067700 [Strongyloides ratti]
MNCITCLRNQLQEINRYSIENDDNTTNFSHYIKKKILKRAHIRIRTKKLILYKKNIRQKYCFLLKLARNGTLELLNKFCRRFIRTPFCRRIIEKWKREEDKFMVSRLSSASELTINYPEPIPSSVDNFCLGLQNLLLFNPKQFVYEIKRLNKIITITTHPVINYQADIRKIKLLGEVIRLKNIVSDVSLDELLHALLNVDLFFGPIFDDSCPGNMTLELEPIPVFELDSSDSLTWLTAPNCLSGTSSKETLPSYSMEIKYIEKNYSDINFRCGTSESMKYERPICRSFNDIVKTEDDINHLNESLLEDDEDIGSDGIFIDALIEEKNEYYERRDIRIMEMIISLRERIMYSNSLLSKIINPLSGDKRIIKLFKETFCEEHEIEITFYSEKPVTEWQFGLFLEENGITNFKLTRFEYSFFFRTHYANDLYKLVRVFSEMRGSIKLPYINYAIDYQITFPHTLTFEETELKDEIMFAQRSIDMEMNY